MSFSPFFKATKAYTCSLCLTGIDRFDRMRLAGPGLYLCNDCGHSVNDEEGPIERGVKEDLAKLTKEAQEGSLAAENLYLAQQLDLGYVSSRDAGTHTKEIRQNLLTLRVMFPPDPEKDETDDFLQRRQGFLNSLRE